MCQWETLNSMIYFKLFICQVSILLIILFKHNRDENISENRNQIGKFNEAQFIHSQIE